MDTHLLNNFLLLTAQEPWCLWWDFTRLVFADFLDESGEHDKALALRTMEVVIADEWDAQGKLLDGIALRFSSELEGFAQAYLWRGGEKTPVVRIDYDLSRGYNWPAEPGNGIFLKELRFSVKIPSEHSADYTLIFREGELRGTLSLDRAQRRCRRRVLEMFPDRVIHRQPGLFQIRSHAAAAALLPDDSPRWVPFPWQAEQAAIEFPEAFEAGRRMAYERERRIGSIHGRRTGVR